MTQPILSQKKSKTLVFCLFFTGIVMLSYLGSWWPGIMLVIGLPLALKQYLARRLHDVAITLFVFLGVFVTVAFEIQWELLLPIIFTLGGIYVIFREFIEGNPTTEVEQEEDLNEEIEEELHK